VTLVDTNVLLDLATDDPRWAAWSVRQLEAASLRGSLLINHAVAVSQTPQAWRRA
jgi:hypothetical protein